MQVIKQVRKSLPFGAHPLVLETGCIARQASAAVMVSLGDTKVLAAVVRVASTGADRGFFPLTVEYQERSYAAGKIPGGFFKREGRPSEKEILTARLIDRSLRPLFPKGFKDEVQIIITVLSSDPQIDSDIPALIGASAAVSLTGMPFNGPVGAFRVGLVSDKYILAPTRSQLHESQLDLVIAGTDKAVLMVESNARIISEKQMLGAIAFGHNHLVPVITAINEMVAEAGVNSAPAWQPPDNAALLTAVGEKYQRDIEMGYAIADKLQRRAQLSEVRSRAVEELSSVSSAAAADDSWTEQQIEAAFETLERETMRRATLNSGRRIDGRSAADIRSISCETGVAARAHGSAMFTRGGTQAMVFTTLGTERDAQIVDALEGDRRESFMLHYNFPPYCVGESGRIGIPRRREIGHGHLARRAISGVLPRTDDFSYVVRVVSEITESDGSSSMATVCGTSLSLMDAGVPIANPVAGIAMGLIKEGEHFLVLSDITGDEDHLGDMDFKVAGTAEGITALQMDIKVEGITPQIMEVALEQAQRGRLHILNEMSQVLAAPRSEMSEYAPRIVTYSIPTEKIRDVIGKGGSTIRSITEETGTTIDISDNGTIKIASLDRSASDEAWRRIEQITQDVKIGMIYDGQVKKLMDFGAFVNILPGRDGLVHISQISDEHVERISDWINEGDRVKVKVLEIDKQGRIRLSIKAAMHPH